MRIATMITAPLFAALVFAGFAAAQSPQPKVNTPQSAPQDSSATAPQASAASTEEAPHTTPVFWISSVEVLRSTHTPQLDVVRVRGLVTTGDWEGAELVPLTKGTPVDGILDLALVAEPPSDNTAPASYPVIEAIFAIEPGHPFTGVRVHGAANRVMLKSFPGYAEAPAPPRDCSSCAGKYLVRKGGAAPSGRGRDNVVREEELPQNLRILSADGGIGSLESDPNRMTLLLNEKGEIISAMWD